MVHMSQRHHSDGRENFAGRPRLIDDSYTIILCGENIVQRAGLKLETDIMTADIMVSIVARR